MRGQDVAAGPRDRFRGYRFALSVVAILAIVLYSDYLSYGLPAPSEAAPALDADMPKPGPAKPEPAVFLARLPPELEAMPGGTAPAVAEANAAGAVEDGEFRDAPGVVEPDTAAAETSARSDDAPSGFDLPPLPDLAPPQAAPIVASVRRDEVQLAALTPGMLPAPATVPLVPPERPAPGLPPWRANAVPFEHRPGQKLIAIIIDDAGLDRARTARAMRLVGPLTISFLPYAADVARQAAEARRHGHELMLHAPMEPLSPFEHPGPEALTTLLSRSELLRRLEANLARFDGYVGVNNHMGSRITQSREAMQPLLEVIGERGLLFVDSRTIGNTVAGALADRLGIPGTARDVFIDHDGSAGAVRARLADIERIAMRTGRAVAIGHPHDVTLDALEQWLPGLGGRGFTLAPVSAIVQVRQEAMR